MVFQSFSLKLFGKIFGKILHFKATKQKTVTIASTKAKLLAFTVIAKEYIW
jgi:hypothetical protein